MKQLPTKSRLNRGLSQLSRRFQPTFGRISATGLGLLLLTGGMWVSQTVFHPPMAQAYKNRVDVRLDRLRDETYQSMIRRAEIVARAAAQRSFDRDILMSEVSVMVIGEYQGAEAPLLLLEVSRQNWRQRPDTRRWATYYRTARTLLKLPSAADPARPNIAPQPINPGLPNVQPIEQPISAPQTITPTPVVPPAAEAKPAEALQPGVPLPVPTPAAVPSPTVSPQVTPVVPQTAPKAAPTKTSAQDAADAVAKAAAQAAAEAAAKQQ